MYYSIVKTRAHARFVFIAPSSDVKTARAEIENLLEIFNECALSDRDVGAMSSGLRPIENAAERFGLNDDSKRLLYDCHLAICEYLNHES